MTTPTITITGPTGSGKTALAIAIHDALLALGIQVVVNDVDVLAGTAMRHLQDQRLEALGEAWKASGPVALYTATPTREHGTVERPYADGEVCS